MWRLKKFQFKKIILLYSLFLTLSIVIISIFLLYFLKPSVPNDLSKYYINGEIFHVADEDWFVSISELQKSIISAEDLQNIFIQRYIKLAGLVLFGVFVVIYICSLFLSNYLNNRVKRPISKVVRHLNLKNNTHKFYDQTIFPKEFEAIEKAFENAIENINYLKEDFNNLSHYVSHEQKNALATIRAKIQNDYSLGNKDEILKQVDRMVKSLDDILTICVHNNDDLTEITDLSMACGIAVDEYKKVYKNITYEFDEECLCYVRGKELWIYRAICNLIDNAIKYGNNSSIRVEVGMKHNCPFVAVSDSGIGIRMEQQDKIFLSGYRIGNIKKDGYGIGLSLVKHVAELCNGIVWIDSEEGTGSTFKIIFPEIDMC